MNRFLLAALMTAGATLSACAYNDTLGATSS